MRHLSPIDMIAQSDDGVDEDSIINGLALGAEPGSVFVFIQSFFDESYDNNLLCVAGYSFTSRGARLLDEEWRKMLIRYNKLPFFRMSLCNARKPPFDKLSEQECIDVATEAMDLIKKYALCGYAITVDKKVFYKRMIKNKYFGTPYEFCSWIGLIGCRSEIAKMNVQYSGMSFIFEAGFQDEPAANRMMNRMFKEPEMRKKYGYKGHYFLDKAESRPTQAADLLSWQWYKDSTRRAKGLNKPRGDLSYLVNGRVPHHVIHIEDDKILEIAGYLASRL